MAIPKLVNNNSLPLWFSQSPESSGLVGRMGVGCEEKKNHGRFLVVGEGRLIQ